MSDEKEKQIFSKNLKYYMELNNKQQIDLITELGVNKSTISTWCNGTKMPRMGTIQTLADYFGIKKSQLVEERTAIPTTAIPYTKPSVRPVPILGWVHCGSPHFADEHIEGYIETEYSIAPDDYYFWLKAVGDSMSNVGIREGDLLLIRQQCTVESGDIAVVIVGDDTATLKRVLLKADAIALIPENSAYETKIFVGKEMENIKICGRLMEVRKRF